MPERVIDSLEVIKIEYKNADQLIVAERSLQRLVQQVRKKAPIGQAGEGVVVRQGIALEQEIGFFPADFTHPVGRQPVKGGHDQQERDPEKVALPGDVFFPRGHHVHHHGIDSADDDRKA